MTTLRFVHSPFVSPSSWQPVADELAGYGWSVEIPSLVEAFGGQEPYMPRLAEAIWAGPRDEGTVLIAHSGAGALIPAALALAPAEAVILVDAVVAQPGLSWRLEAPAELTERLDAFTDCGLLPEWHRWFSARLLRQMLPDDEACEDFIDELPRVPASYLDEVVPQVTAWPPKRGAYLQLSEAYDEDARKAGELGWLVRYAMSDHLAIMTRPDEIAEALQSIIEALGVEP